MPQQHREFTFQKFAVALATASVVGFCMLLAMYGLERMRANEPLPQASANTPSLEEQMRVTFERPAIIARLKAKLDKNPDDSQGWALLARSHAQIGQYAESVHAYRQLLRLQPNDPALLAEFADVLATQNGGQFKGEPDALLTQALRMNPEHPAALLLSGLSAFDRHDGTSAVRHWEHVLRVVEPTSLFAQRAREGLASVRAQKIGH